MMLCPRCESPLVHERACDGTILDACRSCDGVWLGRDDLEGMLERARRSGAPDAARRHEDGYRDRIRRDEAHQRYRDQAVSRRHAHPRHVEDHGDHDDDHRIHDDHSPRYGRERKKRGVLGMLDDLFD